MNLVWFLTIGTLLSVVFGEFGQYPFGVTSFSISIIDILLLLSLIFLTIWKVAIEKKLTIQKSFIPLFVFWGVAFLSLILSGMFEGGLYLIRYIFYSSSFILGYFLIDSKVTSIKNIAQLIFSVGFLLSITGFVQLLALPDLKYLTDFGYDPHINRLVSSFLDPNFTGAFLSITSAIGIYLYLQFKSRQVLILTVVQLAAIVLTFSRSAYLMIGVILLIFGIFKQRKLLLFIIPVLLMLLVFVPRFNERIVGAIKVDHSAAERLISWQNGLILFRERPIIGVGFNNIRQSLSDNNLFRANLVDGGNAGSGIDSSLLFIMATTGVVGLISYLLFLGLTIRNMKIRSLKELTIFRLTIISIIIALLINSQFINSLFYPPIMLIFYLLLGVSVASKED